MIELLGIGIPDPAGGWLLRRVGARTGRELVIVVSARAEERRALLDTIAGRTVPCEGRAWVGGVPVTPHTRALVRKLVAEVRDPAKITSAALRDAEYLVVHDLDAALPPEELDRALRGLEILRRSRRLGVVVSMSDIERARSYAERLLVLAHGRIVAHETPSALAL
jgi:ABC-type branched-subunit amino acid transport system ATPase component